MRNGNYFVKPEKRKIFIDEDVMLHLKSIAKKHNISEEDVLFILLKTYTRDTNVRLKRRQIPVNVYLTPKSSAKLDRIQKKFKTDLSGVFRMLLSSYEKGIDIYLKGDGSYINV